MWSVILQTLSFHAYARWDLGDVRDHVPSRSNPVAAHFDSVFKREVGQHPCPIDLSVALPGSVELLGKTYCFFVSADPDMESCIDSL